MAAFDVNLVQDVNFMIALGIFCILSFAITLWAVFDRKKILGKLQSLNISKTLLKILIHQKNEAFVLWDSKGKVILDSNMNFFIKDHKPLSKIEILQEIFEGEDYNIFKNYVEKLLSNGVPFAQTVSLENDAINLIITGNTIETSEFNETYSVVWFKENTIEENINTFLHEKINRAEGKAKFLELALNKISFPIWIRDKNHKLIWVNQAYIDAVDGKSFANTIESQLELLVNTLSSNLKSMAVDVSLTGTARSESHFIVIDGERKSMDFHVIPYSGDDGSQITLGYAQDITELQETRGSLADHAESYAETMDKFSTAVAIFNSDMRLEYYNKSYLRLWGLQESLLFSHPHYGEILEALREARKLPEQANFPEWKKKQLDLYKEILEPMESMLHLPDGKTLRVVMQHHPLGGTLILYEDVTDYFTLESSYNTLIAVQKETLNNLHEGVAVFGVDGRLKLFNDGFKSMWELSTDFLTSNPHVIDVLKNAMVLIKTENTAQKLQELIVGGEVKKEQSFGQFNLCDEKVINYSLIPLPDGSILILFIDVTDSFKVEYSLRKHNEALEEAQNIKSNFLAHMSYELRNPLNSVIGFSELLEKEYQGPLNQEQHQYIHNILTASEHLMEIINDILDITVIEAGGLSIDATNFNLSELIDNVVKKYQDKITQKSIRVEVDCQEGPHIVLGDERRIQHSVSNLLSNAVKFTDNDGSIHIKTSQDDKNYYISIQDDGVGIERDEIDEIFEKFYTGSNVKRGSGAGLGLSLVKSFIEIHGGKIVVNSTIDIGTTITCELPKMIHIMPMPASITNTNYVNE
jgi:signal transduction histidine kinase